MAGLGLTSSAVRRFRREAQAAARLHHTNIVPVYTEGEENGICYYAMELVTGHSLGEISNHWIQSDEAPTLARLPQESRVRGRGRQGKPNR
jgi:serine/threonine protein kinase